MGRLEQALRAAQAELHAFRRELQASRIELAETLAAQRGVHAEVREGIDEVQRSITESYASFKADLRAMREDVLDVGQSVSRIRWGREAHLAGDERGPIPVPNGRQT